MWRGQLGLPGAACESPGGPGPWDAVLSPGSRGNSCWDSPRSSSAAGPGLGLIWTSFVSQDVPVPLTLLICLSCGWEGRIPPPCCSGAAASSWLGVPGTLRLSDPSNSPDFSSVMEDSLPCFPPVCHLTTGTSQCGTPGQLWKERGQ